MHLGGYQTLMRAFIGKCLREEMAKMKNYPMHKLIAALNEIAAKLPQKPIGLLSHVQGQVHQFKFNIFNTSCSECLVPDSCM